MPLPANDTLLDHAVAERRRVLLGALPWAGLPVVLPFVALYLTAGRPWIAAGQLVAYGLVVTGFWLAQPGQASDVDRGSVVSSVGVWALLTLTVAVAGGIAGVGTSWYLLLAAFSTLLVPPATRWAWIAISIGSIAGFAVLGPLPRPDTLVGYEGWLQLFGNVVLVFGMAVLGMVSQWMLRGQIAELDEAVADAEAASEAADRLLAEVSHQLRTPLASVVGYAELVSERAEEDGRGPDVEDCSRILLASQGLVSILGDVVDMARDGDIVALHPAPTDLGQLVSELRAAVEPLAERKGNELSLTVSQGTTPHIDGGRLRQVLLNLLGNACKFTEHGQIRLHLEGTDPERVRFEVCDSGMGMTEAEVARVFEPFQQAHDGIAGTFGGTGLGLAISRRVVRAMGGELAVESTLGEGSRFYGEVRCHSAA